MNKKGRIATIVLFLAIIALAATAWGQDINEARRHVEGFEFLFACLMQEKLLAGK